MELNSNISILSGSIIGSQNSDVDGKIEIEACIRDPTAATQVQKASSLVQKTSSELLSFYLPLTHGTVKDSKDDKNGTAISVKPPLKHNQYKRSPPKYLPS